MYPDSVSGVHFLFSLIHRKSRFFSKFVNTYSGNKMGEHICFRRNERLATVNPYWRGNPMVRGRFFNRQHRFRPGMGSVLKWRLSPNPQRKEKKTVKWDPKVCYLRSLDAVVGDSLIWLGHNSFFLQLAGFRTRSFSSAEDFLRDDDAEAPGCIILDVRMGGMTGIELQQELNRRGSDLPIIFLSAHGDIEMAMSCVEAGAFNFLVKPPEPEKLQSLVTKAVEKNRMERRQKAHALNLKRLFDTLTTAEKNISYQLAKGLSNPQIAKLLGISERTVQTHRARVYGKLDIENPVELNDFLHEMEEA